MTEIEKVICMVIGEYTFYMCLYVYIFWYRYVLFAIVCGSYLHIFTYSFSSYRGLITFIIYIYIYIYIIYIYVIYIYIYVHTYIQF